MATVAPWSRYLSALSKVTDRVPVVSDRSGRAGRSGRSGGRRSFRRRRQQGTSMSVVTVSVATSWDRPRSSRADASRSSRSTTVVEALGVGSSEKSLSAWTRRWAASGRRRRRGGWRRSPRRWLRRGPRRVCSNLVEHLAGDASDVVHRCRVEEFREVDAQIEVSRQYRQGRRRLRRGDGGAGERLARGQSRDAAEEGATRERYGTGVGRSHLLMASSSPVKT